MSQCKRSQPGLRTLVALCMWLAYLLPSHVSAQAADSLLHQLEFLRSSSMVTLDTGRLQRCSPDTSADALLALLQATNNEWERSQKLQMKVSGSLTSDGSTPSQVISSNQENHSANVGVELSRGTYPDELKFSTEIGVTVDDKEGSFNENLSTVRVSYDRYMTRNLEGYAFINRLSDAIMSIDERYEAGVGIVVEANPLTLLVGEDEALTPEGRRLAKKLTAGIDSLPAPNDTLPAWNYCYQDVQMRRAGRTSAIPRDSSEVRAAVEKAREEAEEARTSVRHRTARLRVGLLFGMYAELEQATLAVQRPDSGTVSLPLKGVRTYRWEVRPTVTMRFTDGLSLRADYYYRKAFAGYRDTASGTGSDFRRDIRVTLTASGGDVAGVGKLTASLEFTRLFDSAPPFANSDRITTGTTIPADLLASVPLLARERRDRVLLKVSVAF